MGSLQTLLAVIIGIALIAFFEPITTVLGVLILAETFGVNPAKVV